MKFAATALAFAPLAVSVALAVSAVPRNAPELAFTVPNQGQQLLTHYRGKVVVLEFIMTTCPHCQAAAKMMTRLQQEYGPKGFQAIDVAINGLDEGRSPKQADDLVAAFIRSQQVGIPVGWTPREQFLSFSEFSVLDRTVVPQVVIIDKKGVIRYETPASGDENSYKEATIRQRIEELLKEPAGRPAPHLSAKRHT